MSWTDSDTVKAHLLGFSVDSLEVDNVEAALIGEEATQLPHLNLMEGSIRVAAVLENAPQGPIAITLTDEEWSELGTSDLLTGSLALTPDLTLIDPYIENKDFAVDYLTGEVKRLPDSAIPSGEEIYAWFIPLTVYEEDVDYTVDLVSGWLSRVDEGAIPNPARVLVKYTTNDAVTADSLISQAIMEAEDKIAARLREGYSLESTDQGLQTGATELVLSQICDDLALHLLGISKDSSADDRAHRFMELARRYEERAAATLARFLTQPLPASLVRKKNPDNATGW